MSTPSKESIGKAVRCWCEPDTSKITMDARLATAFARVLDAEKARTAKLLFALAAITLEPWRTPSTSSIDIATAALAEHQATEESK